MFVHSSRGILLEFRSWSCLVLLIVLPIVSASAQSPDTVLATVNGRDITLKQVDDFVKAQIYPLQQQLYAIRKAALENLVTSRILETEATARGTSIDDLRKQLTVGEITVTRPQIEDAYKQNASFFAAMSPDEAKERLRLDLENQARMKHYRTGLEALRKKWTVTLNLVAPPFVSELDDGHTPAKGSAKPVVTIVEFSDFECPFCREVQGTLNQVVQSFGNEVRLIFKHLPLEGHRNSLPAARAAYCAGEQDRFWPYHDALFASEKLSPAVLDEIALDVGLGMPKFRACLDSEHSRTAIVKDIETARLFRIDSTPSFLVNGKLIKGALSFADFQKIIERELNQRVIEKQSSAN